MLSFQGVKSRHSAPRPTRTSRHPSEGKSLSSWLLVSILISLYSISLHQPAFPSLFHHPIFPYTSSSLQLLFALGLPSPHYLYVNKLGFEPRSLITMLWHGWSANPYCFRFIYGVFHLFAAVYVCACCITYFVSPVLTCYIIFLPSNFFPHPYFCNPTSFPLRISFPFLSI